MLPCNFPSPILWDRKTQCAPLGSTVMILIFFLSFFILLTRNPLIPPEKVPTPTYWNEKIWKFLVTFMIFTIWYNCIYLKEEDITICFTFSGSSDVLNWVCLLICLLLESFGTFWKRRENLNLNLDLNLNLESGLN